MTPTLSQDAVATMAQAAVEIERLRAVNAELVGALSGIRWKSADRDNMEFAATITYSQMDAIRAAINRATNP